MMGSSLYSILSRPPKLRPSVSLALGFGCIPLGLAIQGAIGGGLIGGGVGAILMAAWDFGRLRFVAWRQAQAERVAQ
jgi:hypothetical protein